MVDVTNPSDVVTAEVDVEEEEEAAEQFGTVAPA